MIKINSEIPLCLLNENNKLNEYDFVLFHLYKTNEKYRACWQSVQSLISFLEVIKRENQTASKSKRTRNKTEDKNKKA